MKSFIRVGLGLIFIGTPFFLPACGSSVGDSSTIAARYSVGSAQSVATSTVARVNFDTQEYDTNSAVTTGAATWEFTAPSAGIYQVTCTMTIASGINWAVGERFRLRLIKNSSTAIALLYQEDATAAHTQRIMPKGSATVSLAAGDTIYVEVFQSSGETVSIEAAYSSAVSIERLGAL